MGRENLYDIFISYPNRTSQKKRSLRNLVWCIVIEGVVWAGLIIETAGAHIFEIVLILPRPVFLEIRRPAAITNHV